MLGLMSLSQIETLSENHYFFSIDNASASLLTIIHSIFPTIRKKRPPRGRSFLDTVIMR
jgi:hypothetical protein